MAKKYDLEERTTKFAKAVIEVCRSVKRDPINDRITGQVVGASGSVGANYREANDSLGKKDFIQRLKISRREAKEAHHWLDCLLTANKDKEAEISKLLKESEELKRILSAIIDKSE